MIKQLYLIREDDGYSLCAGKPIPCSAYKIKELPRHNYTFGGDCSGCISIPETHIKMAIGEKPKKVKIAGGKDE